MNNCLFFILHLNSYLFLLTGIPPADERKDYWIHGNVKYYYEYNKKIEEGSQADKITDTTTFKYFSFDKKGRFSGNYYTVNGIKKSSIVNYYDKKGYRTKIFNFKGDTLLTDSAIFFYDLSKRICTKYRYIIGIGPNGKTTYHYDERGRLIKEMDYRADGKCYLTTEFVYDNQGYPIRKTEYRKDKTPDQYIIYTYNKNHHKISEDKYNSENTLIRSETITYTYDAKKNWTKMIYWEDGIPTWITERKIEYF